jgi:hypothetical protein
MAYLDNVCPHNLLVVGSNLGDKPVVSFLTTELRRHIEARIISLIQIDNSIKVLLFQRSQALGASIVW